MRSLLNRAYVYAMKAHGDQTRASGDAYFSHPLEVAAILTELKLDDATIAAALLHDVVEDTEATQREIEEMFGARDRRAGRRADQDPDARPRHQGSRPGGESAQAPAGDVEGRPRAAGQARRPPAQHAHARACPVRQAPAHRPGDDGHLRPAGRPHGHAEHPRGARGHRASRSSIRMPTATISRAAEAAASRRAATCCSRSRRP